ncbi:MAG: family 78 glycoside hydrolase catalytic domain [Mangrovibacterium sp.]
MNKKRNKKESYLLILLIMLLASCTSSVRVSEIKIDGYSNSMPLLDNERPRFSWILTSTKNGECQSSYQIRVAASKEDLQDGKLLWNSGKINSKQSQQLIYAGDSLQSGRIYYWQVRVWDSQDLVTSWSDPKSFLMGLMTADSWSGAQWIGYEQLVDSMRVTEGKNGYSASSKGLVEERAVVPLFRKKFKTSKKIATATLFISGLGQYEAFVNGEKLSDAIFTPSWSDYDKVVYYNGFDVTDKLHSGDNLIAAVVGNGFQYINRERYRKLLIAYSFPRLICNLRITYADGTVENVVSNDSWKVHKSPYIFSSIYGGEDYDGRMELPNWNQVNFNYSSWESAVVVNTPAGKLKADINNPLKVMDIFEPVNKFSIDDSTMIYDFGQNASAKIAATLIGHRDQVVRFYPSEILNDEGRITQKGSGSPYYYEYILADDQEAHLEAKFSYYGFRYVEARGVDARGNCPDLPQVKDVFSQHVRNSSEQVGTFHSSNELFNQIYQLINWAIKSNYQSVMTDCPTREKLGWLEQTHLMGPSVHYNFDVYHIYQKLLADMEVAQQDSGLIPSIVPEYINFGYYDPAYSDSPEWGSAVIMLPYLINKWYADQQIIGKHWSMMNRYMDYLASKSTNYLLAHGLGDWYDIGPNSPGYAQLSSVPLVASATYYHDALVMAAMAERIDDDAKQEHYSMLADSIKQHFNARFYNSELGIYENASQTALAMPLALGLVEKSQEEILLNNLIASIDSAGTVHTTGEVGFPCLLRALTHHGKSDLIYAMNNRDDVPGYGYQIKKGATSLTESWQALAHPSQNHFMIGHLMEWFYNGLAGINQQENSIGYQHLLIQVRPVGDLKQVKATFNTPYGEVLSAWENTDEQFKLTVKIPVNVDALVLLPYEGSVKIENDDHEEMKQITRGGGYELQSGIYHFVVEK